MADFYTSYRFGDTFDGIRPLCLEGGKLTMVAARTGHCKTKFLQNLALQVAKNEGEGMVLMLNNEETLGDLEKELLNIYADIQLADNNFHYFPRYFRGDGQRNAEFDAKTEEFCKLTGDGKLHVIPKVNYAEKAIGLLRHAQKNGIRLKAVFIDSLYWLDYERKRDRATALKDIFRELKEIAKELDIPIVLSDFLEESVKKPSDLCVRNIHEPLGFESYVDSFVFLLFESKHDDGTITIRWMPSESTDYPLTKKFRFRGVTGRIS